MRRPADLEATSQLQLGAKGVFEGEPFTLTGRRCVQGQRGQIWNEWTLEFDRFDHERARAFLAESWGSFALFKEGSLLPTLEELHVGMPLMAPWTVVERGHATRLAKWGDLDDADSSYDYVDLSYRGTPPKRASIAEDETFIGIPIDASTLGLSVRPERPALIRAPNVSMPAGLELWLDLGDVGELEGVEYRVLGMCARTTTGATETTGEETGEPSRWQDYLLYNANIGLRWLSVSDGHWTYAVPIEVGPTGFDLTEHVSAAEAESEAMFVARLEWATGELPWSAEIGEHVFLSERDDMVFEILPSIEVSASRTMELTSDAVAKAFHKRSLPRPR